MNSPDFDLHYHEMAFRLACHERTRVEFQPAFTLFNQRTLANRHLTNGCIVLYDITSTYFEGAYDESDIVQFGYVIKTTVSATAMDKDEVVSRYKSLSRVEQAFRNLKTVSLELRPVHHKKDDRIRAHVFLCMLAYYLQWHFMRHLEPLFDEQRAALKDGTISPKDRSLTLQGVLETLKSLRRNKVSVGEASFHRLTEPNAGQQRILDLLGVTPADPL